MYMVFVYATIVRTEVPSRQYVSSIVKAVPKLPVHWPASGLAYGVMTVWPKPLQPPAALLEL